MHRVNPFVIFLIKRIGVLLVTFFVAITVIFLLPRLIPGNPLATLLYSLVARGQQTQRS